MIATGSVFCALFALALATLPGHRQADGAAPGSITAADDAASFARIGDPSAIAPPASVTRDSPRHPATVGALPELGQRPLPGSSTSTSSPNTPGGSGGPGTGSEPTGSSDGPAPSGPASAPSNGLPDPAHVAQAVFDAINASRRDAGLRTLRWNSGLQTSAHQHNQAMAGSNTLSHQTPGEDDLGTRESDAGVNWTWWAGENIAMSSSLTQQAALDLEAAMVNEQPPNDGHRQNILSRKAQDVGVDVVFDTAHHRLWLTEDFAQTSLL
jgi:uncharacterized protein YkwD